MRRSRWSRSLLGFLGNDREKRPPRHDAATQGGNCVCSDFQASGDADFRFRDPDERSDLSQRKLINVTTMQQGGADLYPLVPRKRQSR
jgi:hypothetical protein